MKVYTRSLPFVFCTFVLALLCCAVPADALTNVVIFQTSFESPALTNQAVEGVGGLKVIGINGWSREDTYTYIWNENNTNITGRVPTPYGEQYAAIWSESGIVTTNITDRLQPGVTYSLTFNAGNANTESGAPMNSINYLAELLAGTNVLTSVSFPTASNDFSVNGVLTYTPDGTNAYLGEIIGIRFAHTSTDWQYYMLIDNVKLEADESVSEWGTTLFLGE